MPRAEAQASAVFGSPVSLAMSASRSHGAAARAPYRPSLLPRTVPASVATDLTPSRSEPTGWVNEPGSGVLTASSSTDGVSATGSVGWACWLQPASIAAVAAHITGKARILVDRVVDDGEPKVAPSRDRGAFPRLIA